MKIRHSKYKSGNIRPDKRNLLYEFLKSKKLPQIIEAAQDLFVNTYNPVYYYLLLQCCKSNSFNIDHAALLEGCNHDCLTLYLLASKDIYNNDIKSAQVLFYQATRRKLLNFKLPLFVLNLNRNKLYFKLRIKDLHSTAVQNIETIKSLTKFRKLRDPQIEPITVEKLEDAEEYYENIESSPGILINSLKRIRAMIMPNGFSYNKIWLEPTNRNQKPIEIEFSVRATSQKSLLLLAMAVRENRVVEKKKFDDEVFLNSETFEEYYKEALRRCGVNIKPYLDDNGCLNFKTTKEWWSLDGVTWRKICVYRVNKKVREKNIRGSILVETLNPEDKAGYMLAENLGALISLK